MKTIRSDLGQRDLDLCRLYVEEMNRKGSPAYEPWEQELVAWATDPDRVPRRSTVAKLRVRFPKEG
jgi:hypothetical protein